MLSSIAAGQLSLGLLSAESGQLLSNAVMNLKVLGHATVNADGLAFGQIAIVVLGRNAFLVTRVDHPYRPTPRTKDGKFRTLESKWRFGAKFFAYLVYMSCIISISISPAIWACC